MTLRTTPAITLVDAVGEDTAVSVLLWLVDLYDAHALEYDGKMLSPSIEWLIDSLRPQLIDGKVLPLGDEEIAAQEAEEDDPADVWVPKRDRKASDER